MSKLFMYGTSLEGIEQLMVMVPNFQPRRSGIVINNYFNCEGGARECNCNVTNINKKQLFQIAKQLSWHHSDIGIKLLWGDIYGLYKYKGSKWKMGNKW